MSTDSEAPLVNPSDLRSWLILENDDLLVFDKPGWLVCHPSKNGPWSSLAGAVREEFKPDAIRIVNRLDRETSGIVVLAKTKKAACRLQYPRRHKVRKLYVSILEGEMPSPITVNQPLGPDPSVNVSVKQHVMEGAGSQEAITSFHPLAVSGGYTFAGIELSTGRKHQIRAHAEWLGHRMVGDKLYGPDPNLYLEFALNGWTARHSELLGMARQALHCAAMDLRPIALDFLLRAPLPADMARFTAERMEIPAAKAQRLLNMFVDEKLTGPAVR